MGSELLGGEAARIREKARKALGDGGSCGINLNATF
jgi:hypothetical protein